MKVVVVGNGCVGKTSMIKQFCKGQYSDEYKKTIGVDFLEKHQYVVLPLPDVDVCQGQLQSQRHDSGA